MVTVATYQKNSFHSTAATTSAFTKLRLSEDWMKSGLWGDQCGTSVVIDQVSWWANVRGVNSDIPVWIANHFWKFVLIEGQSNKVAINCTDCIKVDWLKIHRTFIQNIYRPAVILSNVPPALPFQELPIVRGMRYDHKFGRVNYSIGLSESFHDSDNKSWLDWRFLQEETTSKQNRSFQSWHCWKMQYKHVLTREGDMPQTQSNHKFWWFLILNLLNTWLL